MIDSSAKRAIGGDGRKKPGHPGGDVGSGAGLPRRHQRSVGPLVVATEERDVTAHQIGQRIGRGGRSEQLGRGSHVTGGDETVGRHQERLASRRTGGCDVPGGHQEFDRGQGPSVRKLPRARWIAVATSSSS